MYRTAVPEMSRTKQLNVSLQGTVSAVGGFASLPPRRICDTMTGRAAATVTPAVLIGVFSVAGRRI